jgi:UDP-N-acetylglucosamine acyltransferase
MSLPPPEVHPTAIVSPGASLGAGTRIGPFCVIGPNVELGDECVLHSHVVLDGHTRIGKRNQIFPFACIGKRTQDLKYKGGKTFVRIGDDNTIREYVSVHSATSEGDETVVGSNNYILASCHVAHDCRLGNNIIMSNYAGLAGHVVVEDYAVIGGFAGIHQFCRVGTISMVGGCSKVNMDVAPYMLIDGNPATPRFVNKIGLERCGISETSQMALRQAYKILFRDGLTTANAIVRLETELAGVPEVEHLVSFVRSSQRGIK